jgi:hypothetical protein
LPARKNRWVREVLKSLLIKIVIPRPIDILDRKGKEKSDLLPPDNPLSLGLPDPNPYRKTNFF